MAWVTIDFSAELGTIRRQGKDSEADYSIGVPLRPDTPFAPEDIDRVCEVLRPKDIDRVICHGSGFQVEAAKAICLGLRYSGPISDIYKQKVEPYSACTLVVYPQGWLRGEELFTTCLFHIPSKGFVKRIQLPKLRLGVGPYTPEGITDPQARFIVWARLIELSVSPAVSKGIRAMARALADVIENDSDPSLSSDAFTLFRLADDTRDDGLKVTYAAGIAVAKSKGTRWDSAYLFALTHLFKDDAERISEAASKMGVEPLALDAETEKVVEEKIAGLGVSYTLSR